MIRSNTPSSLSAYDFFMAHRRPMALTFGGIMLVVIAVTFLGPKSYTSEAKLFVRLGLESTAMDPSASAANDQVVMVQESREYEINSVYELLKSREVLTAVVNKIGPETILDVDAAEPAQQAGLLAALSLSGPESIEEKALRHLNSHLAVKPAKKSHIINVFYEARSPELARDVVARLIDEARDVHLKVHRTDGSHEFLEAQANQLRDKVTTLENQLRELKNATGVASLGDQRVLKLRQIADLEDKLRAAEAALAATKAEMAAHEASLDTLPETITTSATTGMPQTAVEAMREQLFTAHAREKELLSRLTPAHPLAIAARKQVVAIEEQLKAEPTDPQVSQGPNESHQAIKLAHMKAAALAAAHEAETSAFSAQLTAARQSMAELNDTETAIARLQREIDLETANYKKYAAHVEQARIEQELAAKNMSNLNIMQPATLAKTPTSPRKLLNLVVGFFGAACASLGLGLVLEQRRSGLLRNWVGYGPASVAMLSGEPAAAVVHARFERGAAAPPGGSGHD